MTDVVFISLGYKITANFSILILGKKIQNEIIFTQFQLILACPNGKTSGLANNLTEAFCSPFK